MKTIVCIILDESGSMWTKRSDIIGGFNAFLDEQKKIKEDESRFFLVKFNTAVSVVHSGIPVENVPELSEATYTPGGGTALYDAIAEGVRLIEKDKQNNERVICVIMTDGEENSSRETTKEQIKEIIKTREERKDWTFVYIGENPERWARETCMSQNNAVGYCHAQPRANFGMMAKACSSLRTSQASRADNLFR
ncbi:von Willebrand factor type A-like protein [Leptotrombidium deliense]|uniref:von Willebrand factor type A-like protein n=1 Tax=Leptotrombidium deliense TaxID=299467 RepID=A0A443SJQ9_9ACAR|nr:von Willebrand factor type A-like protein [Leptotrombidium deliense]